MLFSILVIVIVLGITYMHWVQGLFSGVISVALAVCGAALAMGLHESINASLLGGRFADTGNAIVLCLVFTAVYGIGRVIFDSLISGNVRLPLYVDRVGGGVCGLIVGIFAAGTFAVAAQTLPLGPEVAFFSRYPLAETKSVTVPVPGRKDTDAEVSGSLEDDLPAQDKEVALMLPADSMLVSFANFQSESGSLSAGGPTFKQQHPELLRELFLARTGIETGAKHTALNIGGKSEVGVMAVFAPASLQQMDAEIPQIRTRKVPATLTAKPNQVILIVRTTVKSSASDADKNFRFSPGAVRLVSNGRTNHPVGTLYGAAQLVLANRVDDYLIAKADDQATIDLVFLVDRADVLADAGAKEGLKLRPDAFLEVKHYARVDLAGKDVATRVPELFQGNGVLRKHTLTDLIQRRLGGDTST